MTRRPGKRTSGLLILAVIAFISIGLVAPLLVKNQDASLVLNGGKVLASVGDNYVLTRPIELIASPRVVLERGKLSLIRSDGRSATAGRTLIDMLLGGRATLQIDGADITVELPSPPGSTEANAAYTTADVALEHAPLVDALLQRAFRDVRVHRSTVTVNVPDKDPVVLPNLSMVGKFSPSDQLVLTGSFDLEGHTTQFASEFGLRDAESANAQVPIALTISNALFSAKINGAFRSDERYQIEAGEASLDISDLPKTAKLFAVTIPDRLALKSLSASGRMYWSGSAVAFHDAQINLSDNRGTGTLSLDLKGTRPLLDGTLAYETLDLTAFRPIIDEPATGTDKFMSMTWLSEMTAMLAGGEGSLMRELDADLRLSTDTLIVGGARFGRAAASLSLRDGRMLTDVVELAVDELGTARGQLTVDTNGYAPQYTLKGYLKSVRLGPITEKAVGHKIVRGRGDVQVDLRSQGNNRTTNLGSLNGAISVDMETPSMLAIQIDGFRGLSTRSDGTAVIGWGSAGDGETSVSGLAARLTATNGVLVVEQLLAKSRGAQFAAYGSVVPTDKTIDLKFWVAPRDDEPATIDQALSGIGPTNGNLIQAKGPWANPQITVRSVARDTTHLQ